MTGQIFFHIINHHKTAQLYPNLTDIISHIIIDIPMLEFKKWTNICYRIALKQLSISKNYLIQKLLFLTYTKAVILSSSMFGNDIY